MSFNNVDELYMKTSVIFYINFKYLFLYYIILGLNALASDNLVPPENHDTLKNLITEEVRVKFSSKMNCFENISITDDGSTISDNNSRRSTYDDQTAALIKKTTYDDQISSSIRTLTSSPNSSAYFTSKTTTTLMKNSYVLICDDDSISRRIVIRLFDKFNIPVIPSSGGMEGVSIVINAVKKFYSSKRDLNQDINDNLYEMGNDFDHENESSGNVRKQ